MLGNFIVGLAAVLVVCIILAMGYILMQKLGKLNKKTIMTFIEAVFATDVIILSFSSLALTDVINDIKEQYIKYKNSSEMLLVTDTSVSVSMENIKLKYDLSDTDILVLCQYYKLTGEIPSVGNISTITIPKYEIIGVNDLMDSRNTYQEVYDESREFLTNDIENLGVLKFIADRIITNPTDKEEFVR